MVADIHDNGVPVQVRFIWVIADVPFEMNEILCYELPRIDQTDLSPLRPYVPGYNMPLLASNCEEITSPVPFTITSGPKIIRRTVMITSMGENLHASIDWTKLVDNGN